MKTLIMVCSMIIMFAAFTGSAVGDPFTESSNNNIFGGNTGADVGSYNTFMGAYAGQDNASGSVGNSFFGYYAGADTTDGDNNTFLGYNAGRYNSTGTSNAFLGRSAGYHNTTGGNNTFIGRQAGYDNTTGIRNTFLGDRAGYNASGSENVFLGYQAGYFETDSNKLYIDSSATTTPLIYGEFDNDILTIYGNLGVVAPDNGLIYLTNVTTDTTTKVSRMVLDHYSNSELPVYLFGAASTATANFVALGGGNTIGNAATQLDLFTAPTTTTPLGTPRLTIIGNGNVGIGTQTPSYPLEMAGGAYTDGSSWVDVSSREYKEDIKDLTEEEALAALQGLNPVTYAYKRGRGEQRVGFIAEEVPELVSLKGRKGLSPMDIVAVLTKVVQEQQEVAQEHEKVIQKQQEVIQEYRKAFDEQQKINSVLSAKIAELERALKSKGE